MNTSHLLIFPNAFWETLYCYQIRKSWLATWAPPSYHRCMVAQGNHWRSLTCCRYPVMTVNLKGVWTLRQKTTVHQQALPQKSQKWKKRTRLPQKSSQGSKNLAWSTLRPSGLHRRSLDPDDLPNKLCPDKMGASLAFADSDTIVKYDHGVHLAEAEVLHLVSTLSTQTTIAAPKLLMRTFWMT